MMTSLASAGFVLFIGSVTVASLGAQVPVTVLAEPARASSAVQLTERLRIGSAGGKHDAFGTVLDVAIDRVGHVLVADATTHAISVFDSRGNFVSVIGREGQGPGEFASPALLEFDAHDSLFVWDPGLGRVSVFSPRFQYARSFRVSPVWLVNALRFLPSGNIIVAAFGRGESHVLHVLDREGIETRAFGPEINPPDLAGYEASLLGGTIDLTAQGFVYSNKSPYEIRLFTSAGHEIRRCTAPSSWTTRPADVVELKADRQTLHWSKYVHSMRVVALSNGLLVNEVIDPVADRRTLDLLSQQCELLRRVILAAPVNIRRAVGNSLVAVRTLEYPEVIVYDVRLKPVPK